MLLTFVETWSQLKWYIVNEKFLRIFRKSYPSGCLPTISHSHSQINIYNKSFITLMLKDVRSPQSFKNYSCLQKSFMLYDECCWKCIIFMLVWTFSLGYNFLIFYSFPSAEHFIKLVNSAFVHQWMWNPMLCFFN
jgi:hypothetical protein